MLGRSKVKPGAARAKYRGMAMAQRKKAPTTSVNTQGAKTSAKQPATSTVAAKPSPKPVQPAKSAPAALTREQKFQQAQKFGNAEYLNRPEVRRANEANLKRMEEMATSQIKKVPTTSGGSSVQKPVVERSPVYMPGGGKYTPNERPLNRPSLVGMPPYIPRSPEYDAIKSAAMSGAGNLNPDDSPKMPPRPVERRPIGFVEEAVPMGMKKGGSVKTFKKGGSVDGCAQRGKTKGRYI